MRFTEHQRAVARIVDCEVSHVEIEAATLGKGFVDFIVRLDLNVQFADTDGAEHRRSGQFRFERRAQLPDARPGMDVRFLQKVRCMGCEIIACEGATIMECRGELLLVITAQPEAAAGRAVSLSAQGAS